MSKAANKTAKDKDLFHEKQKLKLCLLHSVNAIFQSEVYSKSDFDKFCKELSPDSFFNPHKSIFGIGDYDANVLLYAFEKKNIETKWFDKRKVKKFNADDYSQNENFKGFIMNEPRNSFLGLIKSRHWFAIIVQSKQWWNLDSRLNKPEPLKNPTQFIKKILNQSGHLMILHKMKSPKYTNNTNIDANNTSINSNNNNNYYNINRNSNIPTNFHNNDNEYKNDDDSSQLSSHLGQRNYAYNNNDNNIDRNNNILISLENNEHKNSNIQSSNDSNRIASSDEIINSLINEELSISCVKQNNNNITKSVSAPANINEGLYSLSAKHNVNRKKSPSINQSWTLINGSPNMNDSLCDLSSKHNNNIAKSPAYSKPWPIIPVSSMTDINSPIKINTPSAHTQPHLSYYDE